MLKGGLCRCGFGRSGVELTLSILVFLVCLRSFYISDQQANSSCFFCNEYFDQTNQLGLNPPLHNAGLRTSIIQLV